MIRIFKFPTVVPFLGTGSALVADAGADLLGAMRQAGEQLATSPLRSGETLGIFMEPPDLESYLGQLRTQSVAELPLPPRVPVLDPIRQALPQSELADRWMTGEQWLEFAYPQAVIFRTLLKDDPEDDVSESTIALLRANEETLKTAGIPLIPFLNMRFQDLVHPDHWSRFQVFLEECNKSRGGAIQSFPLFTVRDNEAVYAWSDIWVKMAPNGKEGVAYIVDATERYQNMKDGERQNAELVRYREYLINGPPCSVFELDEKAHIRVPLRSKSLAAMLGYSLEEMERLAITDVLAPSTFPLFADMLRLYQELNQQGGDAVSGRRFEYEIMMRHKDGTEFPVQFTATVGSIDGETFVRADYVDLRPSIIQAQLRAEHENMLKAQERLQLERTAATKVAHTIGNRIQTIDMNNALAASKLARLLAKSQGTLGEEVIAALEDIQQMIATARDLAEAASQELLRFINWQAGVRQVGIFPLHSLIDAAKIRSEVAEKGVESVIILDAHPNSIEADRQMLQDVIAILIENAVEAMAESEKKELTISTANAVLDEASIRELKKYLHVANENRLIPGDYVRVSFQDTGHGIDPSQLPQLFRSGQGLIKASGLIDEFKGSLGVVSRPGKGATFIVFLPRVDSTSDSYRGQSFG